MNIKTTPASSARIHVDLLDLIGWLNERAVEQPEHAQSLRSVAVTLDAFYDGITDPEGKKVQSALSELIEWTQPNEPVSS